MDCRQAVYAPHDLGRPANNPDRSDRPVLVACFVHHIRESGIGPASQIVDITGLRKEEEVLCSSIVDCCMKQDEALML